MLRVYSVHVAHGDEGQAIYHHGIELAYGGTETARQPPARCHPRDFISDVS
jgi:hypothetical protein